MIHSIKQLKRMLFFWIASFTTSISGYFLIKTIIPDHQVFGRLSRMAPYHEDFPIQYIAITCLVYGIVAATLSDRFAKSGTIRQLFLTLIIVIFTVLISSPFGGMLWYYHDMKAGFFLPRWSEIMVENGFRDGILIGWVVIFLSAPYNILGSIVCYILTKYGSKNIE